MVSIGACPRLPSRETRLREAVILVARLAGLAAGRQLDPMAGMAENVRGGLQAVPLGQIEAAKAVGMSSFQINLFIVLPQALRMVIPAIIAAGHIFALVVLAGIVLAGLRSLVRRRHVLRVCEQHHPALEGPRGGCLQYV